MELIVISKDELIDLIRKIMNENFTHAELPIKEEFIDKKEVSKILGVSSSSVDNYRKKGILKSYRVGNKIRFKRSEVVSAATSESASS